MNVNRVLVIIPEYGHRNETEKCIASIGAISDDVEVIVSDDAYPEEQKPFDNAEIQHWQNNLGFAGNVNRATSWAAQTYGLTDTTILAILNNDIEFIDDAFAKLVDTAARRLIAGPAILVPEGYYDRRRGRGPHPQIFGQTQFDKRSRDQSFESIRMLSGACVFIPASMWFHLGGFDCYNFKAYYDDDDFGIRAQVLGYPMVVRLDAGIRHSVHTSYIHPSDDHKTKNQIFTSRLNFERKWPEIPWSPSAYYSTSYISVFDERVLYHGPNYAYILEEGQCQTLV